MTESNMNTTAGDVQAGGGMHSGNSHAQHASGGIVDRVRERAAAELSTQKDRAFEGLGTVAQAVRQSTRQLRDQQHDTIAGYVEQAADQLDRVARQLRDKDLGELMRDAQSLARRQPAVFIGSAFALGLIGARFIKSSSGRAQSEHRRDQRPGRAYGEYQAPTATGTAAASRGTRGASSGVSGTSGSSPTTGAGAASGTFPSASMAGGQTGAPSVAEAAGGTVAKGGSVEPTHDAKPGGRPKRSGTGSERS